MIYSFSKKVDAPRLESEILKSAIVTALDYITSSPTTVNVAFKAALSQEDEGLLNTIVDVHVAIPLPMQVAPSDLDGAPIIRQKAAKAGWAYQMHSLGFETCKLDSLFNKKIDPATLQLSDLGFASLKVYDASGSEITNQQDADTQGVMTVVDWSVNHEMEIIGGRLHQAAPPSDNVYMWVIAAPGIANVMFCQGGMNLKLVGIGGEVQADGRVAKYLNPTQPVVGVNKFRLIFSHPAGFKHQAVMIFELFKP